MSGRRVCHAYLYVEASRLSAAFYTIFANDGRAVRQLLNTPFDKTFKNGELISKWKNYKNVGLNDVRLKQVARPESILASLRESSASRSQQPEATLPREPSASSSAQSDPATLDDSPSGSIVVGVEEIRVSQKRQNRM
jgi:hypothetical protein